MNRRGASARERTAARICRLHAAGYGPEEIAARLRVSRQTVSAALGETGGAPATADATEEAPDRGPGQAWTAAEDGELTRRYFAEGESAPTIAAAMGRSIDSVRWRLSRIAPGRRKQARAWSAQEVETLRGLAAEGRTQGEIAEALGRSVGAVRSKSDALGIKSHSYRHWTADEDETLRATVRAGGTIKEAARRIGRPYPATARRAGQLGLAASRVQRSRREAEKIRALEADVRDLRQAAADLRRTLAAERTARERAEAALARATAAGSRSGKGRNEIPEGRSGTAREAPSTCGGRTPDAATAAPRATGRRSARRPDTAAAPRTPDRGPGQAPKPGAATPKKDAKWVRAMRGATFENGGGAAPSPAPAKVEPDREPAPAAPRQPSPATGVDAEVLRALIRTPGATPAVLAERLGREIQAAALAAARLKKRGFVSQDGGVLRAVRLPDGRPVPAAPGDDEKRRMVAEHLATKGVTRLPEGHAAGATTWPDRVGSTVRGYPSSEDWP